MIKRRSFTLIEVLIATSIITIVATSLYSAFYTGMLSYRRLEAEFETHQNARVILSRIEQDLKNAFAYLITDPKFAGQKEAIEFFTVLDAYSAGRSYPSIYRLKYEFQEKALKRSYSEGVGALVSQTGLVSEELASNIKEISFEYALGLDTPANPYQWQEVWSEEQIKKTPLPLAVKVKLILLENVARGGAVTIQFIKIIPLAVSERAKALKP
jgi:prepilin-type N-terminal cleavage/methylation domain-containing protein